MTYEVAMRKLATAVVQDYAARQHIANTRQLASRMPKMRPAIVESAFRSLRPQRPTVARNVVGNAGSRLGQAIKAAM